MQPLTLLKNSRQNLLTALAPLSLAQLNHIPQGFRNNLIWNLGHLVVTQQLLVYRNSGLQTIVPEELIVKYRKGTVPDGKASQAERAQLERLALELIYKTALDFEQGAFETYTPYATSYGAILNNLHDAMVFNNVHEGLHYGYVLAQRRLV
ncbi:DinB family protein [Eisenibacter elegans]|jgi:hypothetical protein|uniref:DinB family protein n=1 Tax=Eisenibacter elegans TaxID=997 RepID=UPI00047915F4|nr:DinB family protein [Eisenibacter elegans]